MESVWKEENLTKIQAVAKLLSACVIIGRKNDDAKRLLLDCGVDRDIVEAAASVSIDI